MGPVLALNLLQSIQIMTNSLKSFTEFCLKDITTNQEYMEENVQSSVGIITVFLPYLGHEKTVEIAKEAIKTNEC